MKVIRKERSAHFIGQQVGILCRKFFGPWFKYRYDVRIYNDEFVELLFDFGNSRSMRNLSINEKYFNPGVTDNQEPILPNEFDRDHIVSIAECEVINEVFRKISASVIKDREDLVLKEWAEIFAKSEWEKFRAEPHLEYWLKQ